MDDFRQQALDQSNYFRQLHCTGEMKINSSLNDVAQKYAKYLADNNLFEHSHTPDLGENLYTKSKEGGLDWVNGSAAINSWYKEIAKYDFNAPGFSLTTGHFTQLLWAGSTQMGIGIAWTANNETAYVVANYYPRGNVDDQYTTNVLALCKATEAPKPTTTSTAAPEDEATEPDEAVSTDEVSSAGGEKSPAGPVSGNGAANVAAQASAQNNAASGK